MTIECQHGLLARVCELCERDTEIIILRDKVEELTQENNELNRLITQDHELIVSLREQLAAVTQERDLHQRSCESLVACNNDLNATISASQAREEARRKLLLTVPEDHLCLPIQKALALPSDNRALIRSNKLYAAAVLERMCVIPPVLSDNFLREKIEQLRKEAST